MLELLNILEHGFHPGSFRNWGPACRVLVENVSEWFSVFFLVYRPRSLAVQVEGCKSVTTSRRGNCQTHSWLIYGLEAMFASTCWRSGLGVNGMANVECNWYSGKHILIWLFWHFVFVWWYIYLHIMNTQGCIKIYFLNIITTSLVLKSDLERMRMHNSQLCLGEGIP